MATVDGITVAKAQEIANASVISGFINNTTGHLMLQTAGGDEFDAGQVVPPNTSSQRVVVNASGTFTKATYPTATRFLFELWGAGGSGGTGSTSAAGGGGGGGGYFSMSLLPDELSASLTLTVGTGASGAAGGDTIVAGLINGRSIGAGGGGKGNTGTSIGNTYGGGGGGTGITGQSFAGTDATTSSAGAGDPKTFGDYIGAAGSGGSTNSSGNAFYGGGGGGNPSGGSGSSLYGGGGGGHGYDGSNAVTSGNSVKGGNGGAGGTNAAGSNGNVPAGGGGGGGKSSSGSNAGGVGANGRIVITVFID